jgi:antitoxin component of MazEF toxin-antitoxin module
MVTIENDKLIIVIETSLPKEFLADLIKSIFEILQQQEHSEVIDTKRIKETNYFIVELLKAIYE